MTLHEWIRSEKHNGRYWTMAMIADRIGIHATTLSKAVNGHVEARIGLVRRIHRLTDGKVDLPDWPEGA